MPRSIWKNPFLKPFIFKKLYFLKQKNMKIILKSKNFLIFPIFIGVHFLIYNGINFINCKVNEFMIGYKIGEFVITKKYFKSNKLNAH